MFTSLKRALYVARTAARLRRHFLSGLLTHAETYSLLVHLHAGFEPIHELEE